MKSSEQTISYRAALLVSLLGHPFVLLTLTVLIVALHNTSPARAFVIGIVTISVTVVPLLFIIRRSVVTGKWGNHDISDRAERGKFYPIAVAVVALSCLVFWLLDFPRPLLIGIIASLVLLLAAMLINRWSKISLHLTFAAYSAVSLTAIDYRLGAVFILLAVAVAWSRVRLERHSLGQVLGGAALGASAGIFLLRIIGFF
jgi:membrane-associated phospholipid phosphatase